MRVYERRGDRVLCLLSSSNLSVGTPIELFCYRTGSREARHRFKFEENDPCLARVGERWQTGLIQGGRDIPELDSLKP